MPRKKKIVTTPIPQELSRSVGDITEEAYRLYGGYVNTSRAIPRLDGLKVSVARLIYATILQPRGKWLPSHELVPSIQRWHPHGTVGVELANAHLARIGIFDGDGFFGNTSIDGIVSPPAATRYTHVKLSDLYCDILKDLTNPEYIHYHESPQGELEPDYLPCPLPFALFIPISTIGLGVGIRTNIPSFTAKSLYEAYLKDDPNLLRCSVDLIIDDRKSELERLWRTGRGKITYSYKISRCQSPDGKTEGILFETNTELTTEVFVPNLSKFQPLVEEGKVRIEDVTDDTGPKLIISRVPGARISIDDIESLARKCSWKTIEYQCWVTDGIKCFRIPIRDWIKYTIENYIKLLNTATAKKLEKVEFQIAVQKALPVIADYIMNKNPKASDKEINKVLGIPEEIIAEVLNKPISYLRKNKDTSDRIKNLKDKIKYLKSFDPVKYTEEIISKL